MVNRYCFPNCVFFAWTFIAMPALLLVTPAIAVSQYRVLTLGLNDFEHTSSDGEKISKVREVNSKGQILGPSWRFNGTNSELGRSAWLYDGIQIIKLVPAGREYTRTDGYEYTDALDLNDAGQVIGRSTRFNGRTGLGVSAWLYHGAATIEIGLTGTDYTSSGGVQYSEPRQLNEAGQATGYSSRFNGGTTQMGQSAWIYDGTQTFEIGLVGPEHTRADGYKDSYAFQLNEAGQVRGVSQRYNGGTADLGRSVWLYNGASIVDIGLTGIEHTRNDGYKYSDHGYHSDPWLNARGKVTGYSLRFNGGGADLGQSAWLYDGTTTIDISLTGSEHTRRDGYRLSGAHPPNVAGQVLGGSKRYNGGTEDMGLSVWIYDGKKTIDLTRTESEHTRHDGYRDSAGLRLSNVGQFVGISRRYNGGSSDLGRSMWLYDGHNVIDIGLTHPEHTRNDGYQASWGGNLSDAGRVTGSSARYNGGNTHLGNSAWFYDGVSTIHIGLTGPEHTRNDGFKESFPLKMNRTGMVLGYSKRYEGGTVGLGDSAWLYNGVTTIGLGLTGPEHTGRDGFKSIDEYDVKINDAGQVTGESFRYNGGTTPLGQDAWFYDPMLDQTFTLQLSQRSDGYAFSRVAYLGEDGLALGIYTLFDEFGNDVGSRAFYFTVADGLHDLGSLVDSDLSAHGWESLALAFQAYGPGYILGYGKLATQSAGQMVFLLIPVPEPCSLPLACWATIFAATLVRGR